MEKGRIREGEEALDDIEHILQNLIDHDMLIDPKEYKFMVTEPPRNPTPLREAFVDLM